MKKKHYYSCLLILILSILPTITVAQKVKIACIGNSITEGIGASSGSTNYNPDIVVIKLGTNDAKKNNWVHKDQYVGYYIELINSFKKLSAHPQIYYSLPPDNTILKGK